MIQTTKISDLKAVIKKAGVSVFVNLPVAVSYHYEVSTPSLVIEVRKDSLLSALNSLPSNLSIEYEIIHYENNNGSSIFLKSSQYIKLTTAI